MRSETKIHRNNFIRDIVLVAILISLPFLFFVYNFAPENEQIWKTNFFTIDAGSFKEVDYYLWYYCHILLILFILILWFVSCKHWWRIMIFIPIVVELKELIDLLIGKKSQMLNGIINPIYLFIIPLIILILVLSKKLKYYSSRKRFDYILNEEINTLMNKLSVFKNQDYRVLKIKLIELRKNKSIMTKKEYLKELISLKNSISTLED